VGSQDAWQAAVIACTTASNEAAHSQRLLQQVVEWLERNWQDIEVVDNQIEII
jgi:uncharacterized protein YlxP (DUF503 family)